MPVRYRAVLCSALGLALVLVGCNPSTDPIGALSDPTTTAAQAAALDSAFSAPAVASFQSLGGQIHLAPAVNRGAISALSLAQPGQDRYVALARQSRALQQAVPSFATPRTTGIFPDTLLGSVYAWNTQSGRYTRSAPTGGPVNGIRFLLYATAQGADHPSLPLVQVGYADLLDESAGATARLHILVKNNAGTVTYVDYTFTGSGSGSSFTASVVGTVSNGLAGSANKTLSFNIAVSGSNASVTLTSSVSLNNPSVTVQETVTVVDDGTTTTLTMNLTFTRPGESVTLAGSVAISDADGSATVNVAITVNGGSYARITGSTDQPVITRTRGGRLTADEMTALRYLFVAAADVAEHVTAMFAPAQRILGF